MVISNIVGGLGNQMFQFACGRAVSLQSRQPMKIAVDCMTNYGLHNGFELHSVFNCHAPLASRGDLRKLIGWRSPPLIRRAVSRLRLEPNLRSGWCAEPHFQYWPGIMGITGTTRGTYLHGYWQSEKYFADVAATIRSDFNFRMPWDAEDTAVRDRMQSQPSASVHIRRGDYVTGKNQRVYASCSLDYYLAAIKHIKACVPHVKFYFFSDDPDWVRNHFGAISEGLEVVDHNHGARSAHDMRLMALADHHVIANSSFSWWAAWLNPSTSKMVIAPKQWFLNGTVDSDLIPASWTRL